jgi:hypothetical protein
MLVFKAFRTLFLGTLKQISSTDPDLCGLEIITLENKFSMTKVKFTKKMFLNSLKKPTKKLQLFLRKKS